jgi:hypothetical protein
MSKNYSIDIFDRKSVYGILLNSYPCKIRIKNIAHSSVLDYLKKTDFYEKYDINILIDIIVAKIIQYPDIFNMLREMNIKKKPGRYLTLHDTDKKLDRMTADIYMCVLTFLPSSRSIRNVSGADKHILSQFINVIINGKSHKITKKNNDIYINNIKLVVKSPKEMSDEERDVYDENIELGKDVAKLKSALFYFYEHFPEIDGDGAYMELMDTFIIKIYKAEKLAKTWNIDMYTIKSSNCNEEVDLPSTGSDLGGYDFNRMIDDLSVKC